MFWSKARKIKELESDLDAMEKLIGSIKIQRDEALAELAKIKEDYANRVAESSKFQADALSSRSERDQLHQKVGELEAKVKDWEMGSIVKGLDEVNRAD